MMKRSKNHRGERQNRLTTGKQPVALASAELLIFQIRQTSSSRKATDRLPLISFDLIPGSFSDPRPTTSIESIHCRCPSVGELIKKDETALLIEYVNNI